MDQHIKFKMFEPKIKFRRDKSYEKYLDRRRFIGDFENKKIGSFSSKYASL